MTASSSTPPLAKYFASTEKSVRDKAIKNLSQFLSDSDEVLPPPEMAKLWKGIFYCFWMSDKPLVQQALATELAQIILTISSTPASLAFLDGFWISHVREWGGIDRLRIDKYYMLVRRYVNASFTLLIRNGWDAEVVAEYNRILSHEGGPLCPTDTKIPNSLAYHLVDIYLEELDKAIAKSSTDADIPPVPLATLLSPFLSLASRTPNPTTYKRIQSSVLEPILSALSTDDQPRSAKRARLEPSASDASDSVYGHILSNACAEVGETSVLGQSTLRSKLLRTIFDAASDSETRPSSRKRLYEVWRDGGEE